MRRRRIVLEENRRTFDALVDRFGAAALRHAQRVFMTLEDAQDAVENAFERAWVVVRDGGSVNLSWLLRVIDTSSGDSQTPAPVRQAPALLGEVLRAAASPEGDLRIDLEWVFSGLSIGERHLIELVDMDGWTVATAAKMLGLRQAVARKRLQRARQKLHALLFAAEVGLRAGGEHVRSA